MKLEQSAGNIRHPGLRSQVVAFARLARQANVDATRFQSRIKVLGAMEAQLELQDAEDVQFGLVLEPEISLEESLGRISKPNRSDSYSNGEKTFIGMKKQERFSTELGMLQLCRSRRKAIICEAIKIGNGMQESDGAVQLKRKASTYQSSTASPVSCRLFGQRKTSGDLLPAPKTSTLRLS